MTDIRLIVLACAALALAVTPAVAAADPPAAGLEALVDVGGHRLYVQCTGRGGPTVVLESGLGSDSRVWDRVQPSVAEFTTVCSYDRAGRGRSDPGPTPRTSRTTVDELRALLHSAGIGGPYVLVGHSFGGQHAQLFARADGGRVVTGVVLVDATPLDWADVLDTFGLPVPTPSQNPEGADVRASAAEVLAAGPFPNVPLVALGRTVYPPGTPPLAASLWDERQAAYAQLSCRGEFSAAAGAGHSIHRDRPDLVIAAIERVVEAAHATSALRLHPTGHALPGGPQGDPDGGRWEHCPA